MKLFRNITIIVGLVWVICFSIVLISKLKVIDEMFMSFSILSLYSFVILGVSYLITYSVIKIRKIIKTKRNIAYLK